MVKARFTFERNKKKGTCPGCGQSSKWRFYTDTKTGERLPDQYGACDRENNCAYALDPNKDGYKEQVYQRERSQDWTPQPLNQLPAPKPITPVYIPLNVLERSMTHCGTDTLLFNLIAGNAIKRAFSKEIVSQIVQRYKVGVSNAWIKGATTFPFIDINGNIQGVQVKKFDHTNHTEKFIDGEGQKHPKQNTLHKIISKECDKAKVNYPEWLTAYNDYQEKGGKILNCFFGEHLLNEDIEQVIAIVEAPKTAIVASVYFPAFTWIASGGLSYLTADRCKVLKGRKVVLFPDLGCLDKWQQKAEQLKDITAMKVFPFLEENATPEEKERDLDLCDYLLQFDYLEFTGKAEVKQEEPKPSIDFTERLSVAREAMAYRAESWDIEQIESELKALDIPEHPIKLNENSMVQDCRKFVQSHMETIKSNNGKIIFKPYYDRLKQFIEVVKQSEQYQHNTI